MPRCAARSYILSSRHFSLGSTSGFLYFTLDKYW